MLLTYAQLHEWVRKELVPKADPATACQEWADLTYRGDAEAFLQKVEQLMMYYPIKRNAMLTFVSRPFGEEFAADLSNIDMAYGESGMSFPRLKKYLRNYMVKLGTLAKAQ